LRIVLTIGLVLFSTVALVAFLLSISNAVPKSENVENLEGRLKSVDLRAFLTLTDRRDAEFLYHSVQPAALRRLLRLRAWASLKYLKDLSWNVAILLRIGELASQSTDQSIADAGRELAGTAFRTRLLILRAFLKLAPQLVIPTYASAPGSQLLSDYLELNRRLTFVTHRFHPL
jgi:hypothetical protein